jgi:hypothetical protein
MIVDQVAGNIDLALFHARMVSLLQSTFPQTAMDLILRQELRDGFQSVYFPPTASTVAVYYGGDNQRKIMYLGGATSLVLANDLIAGYASALGLRIIQGPNAWISANLPQYLAMMNGNHLQTPTYLDFCGYSAGGAIAESLAYFMRSRGNLQRKKVFTFGAPRPGGPWVRDGLQTVPVARYMTPADPIPLVPPRLQDAPAIVAALPFSVALSWSNMVHPHGGIVVNSDGSTEEAIEPPQAAMTPGTSLASWFFVTEGEEANPHAMRQYIAYLLSASQRFGSPREKTRGLSGGEDADEPKRRNINQAREKTVRAIATNQREQSATIANHPAIALFKPERQGKIWTVVFGDKIVCQGVREDTCRHLCRVGNEFLKTLPKQGLVDPIGLLGQFEQFLVFAVSPESEWMPKLKTNLNV